MEAYFAVHPDSRTITVVSSGETFPALFDRPSVANNSDGANVNQQKLAPHLTFFSDYADLLSPKTVIQIEGKTKEYKVSRVKADDTEETFQAEAWLY